MTATMPTLLDIAKFIGVDALTGLIEENRYATPEIGGFATYRSDPVPNVGYMREIDGQQFKTVVRTGLPEWSFRYANEGVDASKSEFTNILVETFIANPRIECDIAVANIHPGGWQKKMAVEGAGVMRSLLIGMARQFWYGTANKAKGFPGLQDQVAASMTLDAGGTTANTGSSVYAVKFGVQDVGWVLGTGDEGKRLDLSDVRKESITDASGRRFTAYIQELLAYIGVQNLSTTSVARYKDFTTEAGHTVNDDMLSDLLDLFPAGSPPDAIFMTKRSRGQLRKSRTATNATGAYQPMPTEWEGIPILVTDALSNTEALT